MSDDGYTLYYAYRGSGAREKFDTFAEAVEAGYWGDEGGHSYTKRIEGPDGEVLFDREDYDAGILEFAEEEGYVNPDGEEADDE